jgi:hypothetical protein
VTNNIDQQASFIDVNNRWKGTKTFSYGSHSVCWYETLWHRKHLVRSYRHTVVVVSVFAVSVSVLKDVTQLLCPLICSFLHSLNITHVLFLTSTTSFFSDPFCIFIAPHR